MDNERFVKLAQDLVGSTSILLHNRTINVMNKEGIIIASTEKSRIGDVHTGAVQVIKTGQDLAIKSEYISNYSGAKQGYNMPLKENGEIIGVIGIYGEPSEVIELSRLIKQYASKYFELEYLKYNKNIIKELKNKLFSLLMLSTDDTIIEIKRVLNELKIELHPPLKCIRVYISDIGESYLEKHRNIEQIENLFISNGLLNKKHDLWGYENNSIIIIKSLGIYNSSIEFNRDRIQKTINSCKKHIKLSMSEKINSLENINYIYKQVLWSELNMIGDYIDLEEQKTYLDYIIMKLSFNEESNFDKYIKQLKDNMRDLDLKIYIESIEKYLDESKSLNKASKSLFIHKNTLLYRVNKIIEIAGISNLPAFYQEFLLRMIIINYKRKK